MTKRSVGKYSLGTMSRSSRVGEGSGVEWAKGMGRSPTFPGVGKVVVKPSRD